MQPAVSPDGNLVLGGDLDSVQVVDTERMIVIGDVDIPLPAPGLYSGQDLAFSPDGRRAYAHQTLGDAEFAVLCDRARGTCDFRLSRTV